MEQGYSAVGLDLPCGSEAEEPEAVALPCGARRERPTLDATDAFDSEERIMDRYWRLTGLLVVLAVGILGLPCLAGQPASDGPQTEADVLTALMAEAIARQEQGTPDHAEGARWRATPRKTLIPSMTPS